MSTKKDLEELLLQGLYFYAVKDKLLYTKLDKEVCPMTQRCYGASPSIVFFAKFSIVVRERCIYRTVYGCKVINAEKCAFSRVFQLYIYEKRP
jgi:hypothetical protein